MSLSGDGRRTSAVEVLVGDGFLAVGAEAPWPGPAAEELAVLASARPGHGPALAAMSAGLRCSSVLNSPIVVSAMALSKLCPANRRLVRPSGPDNPCSTGQSPSRKREADWPVNWQSATVPIEGAA